MSVEILINKNAGIKEGKKGKKNGIKELFSRFVKKECYHTEPQIESIQIFNDNSTDNSTDNSNTIKNISNPNMLRGSKYISYQYHEFITNCDGKKDGKKDEKIEEKKETTKETPKSDTSISKIRKQKIRSQYHIKDIKRNSI